jgi:pilus assembly protein CpaE
MSTLPPPPPPSPDQAIVVVVWGDPGGDDHISAIPTATYDKNVRIRPVAAEGFAGSAPMEVAARLLGARPQVICFGADIPVETILRVAADVQAASPGVEMLLVGDSSPMLWAECARAGIREIVPRDALRDEFAAAVGLAIDRALRLRRHLVEQAASARRPARVIAVLSPKGGSGKTTVAANLAVSLAAEAPDRVVLVDFDCQFGDVATSLGLDPERTLTELGKVKELDGSTVKLFLDHHDDSGLYVLASSGTPEEADLIDEPKAIEILKVLTTDFHYIVVDTAAGIDERSLAAIMQATDIVFVASMDVTSIRNLAKEIELLDQLNLPEQNRQFVLNRVDSNAGLRVSEIEASLGMQARHQLENNQLVLRRLNEGRPIAITDPRSKLAKEFQSMARDLLQPDDLQKQGRRRR